MNHAELFPFLDLAMVLLWLIGRSAATFAKSNFLPNKLSIFKIVVFSLIIIIRFINNDDTINCTLPGHGGDLAAAGHGKSPKKSYSRQFRFV